ncbi:hypothetical protein MJH12_13155, partial [bacterium]|nr:hypothetical protein [bacterium]
VGRSQSIYECKKRLESYRIVCITGPHGMGKTAFLKRLCFQTDAGLFIELNSPVQTKQLSQEISNYSQCKFVYIDNIEQIESESFSNFVTKLLNQFKNKRFVFTSTININQSRLPFISIIQLLELEKIDSLIWLRQKLIDHSFPPLSENEEYLFHLATLGFPYAIASYIDIILDGIEKVPEIDLLNSKYSCQFKTFVSESILKDLNDDCIDILKYASLNQGQLSLKEVEFLIHKSNIAIDIKSLFNTYLLLIESPSFFYINNFISIFYKKYSDVDLKYIKNLCKMKLHFIQDESTISFSDIFNLAMDSQSSHLIIDTIIEFQKQQSINCSLNSKVHSKLLKLMDIKENYRYQELLIAFIEIQLREDPEESLSSFIEELENKQLEVYYLGLYHFLKFNATKSNSYFLSYLKSSNNISLNFYSQTLMAYNYHSLGQQDNAHVYFLKAESLITQIDDPTKLTCFYKYYSMYLGYMGKYNQSLTNVQKGIELSITHSINSDLLELLCFKAFILSNEMKLFEAMEVCKQALNHNKSIKDIGREILIYDHMANIYFIKEDFLEALKTAKKAIKLFEQYENDYLASCLHCRIASIQVRLLDFDNAKLSFTKSYSYLESSENKTRKVFNDLNYSEYLMFTEQYKQANSLLEDILDKSIEYDLIEVRVHALYLLTSISKLLKDSVKEGKYFSQYNLYFKELDSNGTNQLINDMRWVEKHISSQLNNICIKTDKRSKTVCESDLKDSNKLILDHHLYINFVSKEAYLHQEKVNLFTKKILVKILFYLIVNSDREVLPEEIFYEIWKKKYDPEIDSTLRVNMIRLRKIFSDSDFEELIQSPNRNSYQIKFPSSYCIIYKDLKIKLK